MQISKAPDPSIPRLACHPLPPTWSNSNHAWPRRSRMKGPYQRRTPPKQCDCSRVQSWPGLGVLAPSQFTPECRGKAGTLHTCRNLHRRWDARLSRGHLRVPYLNAVRLLFWSYLPHVAQTSIGCRRDLGSRYGGDTMATLPGFKMFSSTNSIKGLCISSSSNSLSLSSILTVQYFGVSSFSHFQHVSPTLDLCSPVLLPHLRMVYISQPTSATTRAVCTSFPTFVTFSHAHTPNRTNFADSSSAPIY